MSNLETHEILRGVFREVAVREPACWLRLCHRCHHDEIHGKPRYWTYAKQLGIKFLHDPTCYDRLKCNKLYSLGAVANLERVTEREVAEAVSEMLVRHEVYLPQ